MLVEWNTIQLLVPEAALVLAASAIFVAGAFTRSRAWWATCSIISYLVASAILFNQHSSFAASSILSGPVVMDPMSLGLRWLGLLVGFVFTLVAARLADEDLASEYFGCLMLVAAGIMITASANELVLLFLGLELISIPTYVLLFLGRRDRASGEATMKYFYLSILSSALLLYGFSLLYGLGKTTLIAGTAAIPGIREAITALSPAASLAPLASLALVLVTAGLGFKLTIGGRLCLAARADPGHPHHDHWQRLRAVAAECPPPHGLLLDRPRRLPVDRSGCRGCSDRRHTGCVSRRHHGHALLRFRVLPGDDGHVRRAGSSRLRPPRPE
ncbi:MAG: hypothetical protein JF612_08575 [Planctomycetia bacterium]|nr:hypothetical protein [Planctomycetia bacterium]